MIGRVAKTITGWGVKDGYFDVRGGGADVPRRADAPAACNQKMAFNSPVWFNVGVEEKPQCSACFILSVDDTMESILDWCKTEGMIFKGGSGSGVNLSPIRSSKEQLSAGGQASGPISFMRGRRLDRGLDQVRREDAARGQDGRPERRPPGCRGVHRCKVNEERKAYALGEAGWDMSLNGDAWSQHPVPEREQQRSA